MMRPTSTPSSPNGICCPLVDIRGPFGRLVAQAILVEVLARALLAFAPFQERAVEERDGLDQHHQAEDADQHLEQEVGVEARGAEADGLDIPALANVRSSVSVAFTGGVTRCRHMKNQP